VNFVGVKSLQSFFEPEGVALVGARRSPGFGYGIPLFLQAQGWANRLYLVNPAGGELHGMKVFKALKDIPPPFDLAIVIVPAETVPGVLKEIGGRGIKSVIVESAGFAETGEKGRALQEEIGTIARGYGMRVIGPNCVGVVNTLNRFASVELLEESMTPGPVSIIAQSGVFGNILLDHLPHCGLFISKAITLGNRADVDENDSLDYLGSDPTTKVIMLYLEGAADGRRLVKTLKQVTPQKPVLILKSGRTGAGKQATASHTGSMSGEDSIYDAVFSQTQAIRAQSLPHLIDLARVFATQPLPKGNRLGIITTSGSLGALATDVAVSAGLSVPNLSQSTADHVREMAPDWMNVRNPLDVGPSGTFSRALPLLLADDGVDMVLSIMVIPYAVVKNVETMGFTLKDWFGDMESLRGRFPDKPLLGVVIGHPEFVGEVASLCGPYTPVFNAPEPATLALGALRGYAKGRAESR
jgi:acyl-CoA synthetase (NDP forming)